MAQRGLVAASWSGGMQPPVSVATLTMGNALFSTATSASTVERDAVRRKRSNKSQLY